MQFIRIGNAQGFWGDSKIAPITLLSQQPDLDYLTLDYLAEVSMSIMAIQKEKDPQLGYAKDFIDVVHSLVPLWKAGSKCKIITNAGGLNPVGCGIVLQKLLKEMQLPLSIAVITGDDVLPLCKQNPKNPLFNNLDDQRSFEVIQESVVTANSYLGAQSIAEALKNGADIVVTGRVADPSLTVAPCMAHFGWSDRDYQKIAGATIAGHLIECGTQVTGGISTHWLTIPNVLSIGFPVVEVYADGSCIITKPANTGGEVSIRTVKEQLLYEIGDPKHYLSPDATVSFLGLKLEKNGKDRIHITGAIGEPPPSTYKVSATYRNGYRADGILSIFGRDAYLKAKKCGEILLERMAKAGFSPQRSNIECLGGGGALVPGVVASQKGGLECVLRVAIADLRFPVLEFFSNELASLVTCGPQGLTGYISGKPHIRPLFGYWPCLIEREKINPIIMNN